MGSPVGSRWTAVTVVVAAVAIALVQPSASADVASQESLMVALVNGHRRDVGLSTLVPHDGLRELARLQSQRMAASGDIFHNPNLYEEMNIHAPGWVLVGENVGMGSGAEHVQSLFVSSPGHLANIEGSDWTHLAVGAASSSNGLAFFTQIFVRFTPVRHVAPPAQPVRVPAPKPQPVPRVTPEPVPEPEAVPEAQPVAEPTISSTPSPTPPLPAGRRPAVQMRQDGMADVASRLLVRLGLAAGPN